MVSKPDELLPTIVDAGDSGLSIGKITKKFACKSKGKERPAEVRGKMATLVRDGAIWGPLNGRSHEHRGVHGCRAECDPGSSAIMKRAK
jgi:hypothetical protein